MAVTTPCLNEEQAQHKVIMDSIAIQNLQKQGHPVRDVSAWWSPTTMECHCLPIFRTDSWQDVCTRYFDHYPKEAQETIDELIIEKQNFIKNGFSKSKNLMLVGKIPGGLRKLLDIWHPQNDFWSDRSLLNQFFDYFPKFKGATPYSAQITVPGGLN